MGALHAGHRANFARARRENAFLVGSIFVNPLQFGPGEDLDAYPRDLDTDLEVCAAEGVDLVFTPEERELWPRPPGVRLCVGELAERLEGARRPGHLDGVATVVAKLLNLGGPVSATPPSWNGSPPSWSRPSPPSRCSTSPWWTPTASRRWRPPRPGRCWRSRRASAAPA